MIQIDGVEKIDRIKEGNISKVLPNKKNLESYLTPY